MKPHFKFQIESKPQLDVNLQPIDMKMGALTTNQFAIQTPLNHFALTKSTKLTWVCKKFSL